MPIRLASYLLIAILISPELTAPSMGQAPPQNVNWINVINCTIAGASLQKTAGRTDSADAGARSQQTVTSGDAYLEFTAGDSNKILFCGLTHAAIGTGYVEIDFAIKLTEIGVAEVRENNVYTGEIPYRTGDMFRVAVQAGVVRYYKNGGLFQSSLKSPAYPLFGDASFLTLGGRIDNAVIGALAVSASATWTTYQHDSAHSGYSTESQVNAGNVQTLAEAWRFGTGDWVTGAPIVADGVVYIGSWDGKMYALRERDGSVIWSYNDGTLLVDRCGTTYGIDSTAALSGGRLFFGDGQAQLTALNAANGQLIWRSQLADPALAFHIWGSPLAFDGKIYIGLASHCVNPCVVGKLVCVDANNGRVLWSFGAAPEGSTGGAIWSSAAVDPARRLIYVGTGNYCTGADSHSSAIIALNADTGALVWRFKRIPQEDLNNLDFGASPVLFDINGQPVVAVPSKDGHCYALHRATGELIWDAAVSDGNSRGGSISSPAAAYGKIFFGATVQITTGKVVALDQRDGRIVWENALPAPVLGAAAVAGGVVFIGGADGALHAYDASTGTQLWAAQRSSMLGGVSISAASVFTGSLDHNIYAFALPDASPPPASAALSVTSPLAGEQWTKGQRYNIIWSASGGVSKVDVSISRDGGATWNLLASAIDAAPSLIQVKAKKPKSETVIIRVSDSSNAAVFGESGVFQIR